MAWWLVALAAAFVYLIWLSWFDARHHRPYVALSAALLATAYLGMIVVVAADPWISLPLWPTIGVFVLVEVIVRSLHRLAALREIAVRPQYPVENP